MSNTFKVTPRKAREFISDVLQAGNVPYLHSSPGMGKSAIIKSLSNELRLKVIDHRLSTSEPTDMNGLPNFDKDGYAYFAPFRQVFPIEGMSLPKKQIRDEEGKLVGEEELDGWNVFLDELPAAQRNVQAAAFKFILDRQVGQYNLHPNVVITAAGNLMTDRSVVNPLVTAMQSRLVHLEMEISHPEWLEDVALAENYDQRVVAFLMQFPDKLMDFKPDHHDKTFACPRTWEFLNNQLKSYTHRRKPIDDSMAALFAGYVGSGVAVEFLQFTKVWSQLVTMRDIRRSPTTCAVPVDSAIKWATISHMMQQVDDDNFMDVSTYADRFDVSFRLLFYRFLLIRKPELRTHKGFGPAIGRISQYLNTP